MAGLIQALILLGQLLPSALKIIQMWQDHHKAELSAENRARLAADVKTAVQVAVDTKTTVGLEDVIKNLGKPPVNSTPTDTPSSQSPSVAEQGKV